MMFFFISPFDVFILRFIHMYVHVYLQNHEKLPYAFYIKDYEIETTLADLLQFLLQKKVLANIEEKIIIEQDEEVEKNANPATTPPQQQPTRPEKDNNNNPVGNTSPRHRKLVAQNTKNTEKND